MFKVKFVGGPLSGETHDTADQPAPGFWIGTDRSGKKEWTLYRIVHQNGHYLLAEPDDQVAAKG